MKKLLLTLLLGMLHSVTFASFNATITLTINGPSGITDAYYWKCEYMPAPGQNGYGTWFTGGSTFDLRNQAPGTVQVFYNVAFNQGATYQANPSAGSKYRMRNTQTGALGPEVESGTTSCSLTVSRDGTTPQKHCFTPFYYNEGAVAGIYTVYVLGVQKIRQPVGPGELYEGTEICVANKSDVVVRWMKSGIDPVTGLPTAVVENIGNDEFDWNTTAETPPATVTPQPEERAKYNLNDTNNLLILPGTNDTTIAGLNAIYAGVKDLRAGVDLASDKAGMMGMSGSNQLFGINDTLRGLTNQAGLRGAGVTNVLTDGGTNTAALRSATNLLGIINTNLGREFESNRIARSQSLDSILGMSNGLAWTSEKQGGIEAGLQGGRDDLESVAGKFAAIDIGSAPGAFEDLFSISLWLGGTQFLVNLNPMSIDGVSSLAEWTRRLFKFFLVLGACLKVISITQRFMTDIYTVPQMKGPTIQGSDALGISAQAANVASMGIAAMYVSSFMVLVAALPIGFVAWFDNGIISSSLANPYLAQGGFVGCGIWLLDQFFPVQTALWAVTGVALYKVSLMGLFWLIGSMLRAMIATLAFGLFCSMDANAGLVTVNNYSGAEVLAIQNSVGRRVPNGSSMQIEAANNSQFTLEFPDTSAVLCLHEESLVNGSMQKFDVVTNHAIGGFAVITRNEQSSFGFFKLGIAAMIPFLGIWYGMRLARTVPGEN